MTRLLNDMARLVASWWRIDRVRISPREGRLLRLQPPCVVVVEDRPAEVLARTLANLPHGASATTVADDRLFADNGLLEVLYECRSVAGDCRLRLTIAPGGALDGIFWTADGRERRITEECVEVYSG